MFCLCVFSLKCRYAVFLSLKTKLLYTCILKAYQTFFFFKTCMLAYYVGASLDFLFVLVGFCSHLYKDAEVESNLNTTYLLLCVFFLKFVTLYLEKKKKSCCFFHTWYFCMHVAGSSAILCRVVGRSGNTTFSRGSRPCELEAAVASFQ